MWRMTLGKTRNLLVLCRVFVYSALLVRESTCNQNFTSATFSPRNIYKSLCNSFVTHPRPSVSVFLMWLIFVCIRFPLNFFVKLSMPQRTIVTV